MDHSRLARPPQQSRSQRSTENILRAAERVLSEEGLAGFTITAIAQESAVSVGGLYRRFSDKQELLRALKERVLRRLEDGVVSEMASSPPRLEEVVQRLVKELSYHFSTDERLWAAFFTPAAGDVQMAQRGALGMVQIFQEFSKAALRDRGSIAHDDPERALRVTFEIVSAPIIRRTLPSAADLPTRSLSWHEFTDGLIRAGLAYLLTKDPRSDC